MERGNVLNSFSDVQSVNPIKEENFNVFYIPKKSLSISDKKKHALMFYDISSLFNKQPLDKVAKKYLGKQKEYTGKYQNKQFPDDILKDKKELSASSYYFLPILKP